MEGVNKAERTSSYATAGLSSRLGPTPTRVNTSSLIGHLSGHTGYSHIDTLQGANIERRHLGTSASSILHHPKLSVERRIVHEPILRSSIVGENHFIHSKSPKETITVGKPIETVTQKAGKISETVIEHPPILKGVFERPSVSFINSIGQQSQSRYIVEGQPLTTGTNVYHHSEKIIKQDSNIDRKTISASTVSLEEFNNLQRIKDRNEELLNSLLRTEGQDKEIINQLRRSLEIYYSRLAELEDKYRRVILERDEISYKLESKTESVNHLKDKLSEAEQEIKLLRSRVQKLEADNSELSSEKAELENQLRMQNAELASKLLTTDFTASDAINRLKIAEERNRHLEKRLLEFEDDFSRMSREYKEYRDRLTSSTSSSQNTHIQHTDKVVTKVLQTSNPELEAATATLMVQLREKTISLEESKAQGESLESRLRQVERNLTEANKNLDAEKSRHQSTISSSENEKRNLLSRLEDSHRKIEDLQSQIRDEKDKTTNLQKQIDSLKNKIKNFEEEIDNLKRDKSTLSTDKKALEMRISAIEIELARLQKQLESKNAENQDLQNDLNNKNAKISALQRTISDLENQLNDLKYQNKGLEGTISNFERKNADMTSKDDVRALNEEIENLKEIIQQLQEQIQAREEELLQEIEELKAVIQKLEEEQDILFEKYEESEENLRLLQEERERLLEFIEQITCDNATLQKTVSKLMAENRALLEAQSHSMSNALSEKIAMQMKRLINMVGII